MTRHLQREELASLETELVDGMSLADLDKGTVV